MNAARSDLKPPNSHLSERHLHKKQRLKVVGPILALALIVFVVAHWRNTAPTAAIAAVTSDANTAATFDYFPAQFDSSAKNKAPEEHIQAF
jgi:hypothetical protein